MKPQLFIFAILVSGYIIYNLFFQIEDDRINTAVNIIYVSIIFAYISFMAYSLLRNIKK